VGDKKIEKEVGGIISKKCLKQAIKNVKSTFLPQKMWNQRQAFSRFFHKKLVNFPQKPVIFHKKQLFFHKIMFN
jgi:hypothetical protein